MVSVPDPESRRYFSRQSSIEVTGRGHEEIAEILRHVARLMSQPVGMKMKSFIAPENTLKMNIEML